MYRGIVFSRLQYEICPNDNDDITNVSWAPFGRRTDSGADVRTDSGADVRTDSGAEVRTDSGAEFRTDNSAKVRTDSGADVLTDGHLLGISFV